jgi:phospholipid/cholesterol/gamma-HCH transport system substrate-binding protein
VEAGQEETAEDGEGMRPARVAALLALLAAFVFVTAALLGGGDGHSYKLLLENGSQLVKGNEVMVAGQAIGTVDGLTLTDDGQAEVEITVDEPLHEGTQALIRSTSLSGIANRYVSISPGPNNMPELDDGATLTQANTTSAVDLDELFNTLDAETRASLQKVIQGSAVWYSGNTEGARASAKYFGPVLQSGERLLAELTRDERVLSEFLVTGADIVGTIAEKRNDLSALTANANQALGAIAAENEALDRSLAALPPFLRQADTTFVNLRAALDDLDPLVATSKRATKDLPGFLRDLRPLAEKAVPVVSDLRIAIATPGKDNDLTDVVKLAPQLEDEAAKAANSSIGAMNATQDDLEFARAYTPEVLSLLGKFGQLAGYYDGHGHYLRVVPTATGAFSYDSASSELEPMFDQPEDMFDFFVNSDAAFETYTGAGEAFDSSGFLRCPGGASQIAQDASTPFADPPIAGGADANDCDPADMVLPVAAP